MSVKFSNVGSNNPEVTWTFTSRNKHEVTRDFTKESRLYGPRFDELLDAARRLSLHAEVETAQHYQYAILTIGKALKKCAPTGESVKEWEASVLAYISKKNILEASKFSGFTETRLLLKEVARGRREAYAAARNPFSQRGKKETQYLIPATMKTIRLEARKAAKASLNRFMSPPAMYAPYLSKLRKIAQENGAPLPVARKKLALRHRMEAVFSKANADGIPAIDLYRLLYPSLQDIMPFFVLLVDALAANVDSAANLQTKRIKNIENPLTGPRLQIMLSKPRAGGDLPPYHVALGDELSVAWVIKSVIELTAELRKVTPESRRGLLFIGAYYARVSLMTGGTRAFAIRSWISKHCLPSFKLNALRPTRAVDEYLKHGDIDRVRVLLRQKSIIVTMEYLAHHLVAGKNDRIIADAQASLLQPFERRRQKAGEMNAHRAKAEKTVLLTHRCEDPTDPTKPHDEHGICSNILFPLNNRHFVMLYEPRNVAFLLQRYEDLRQAQLRLHTARFKAKNYIYELRYIEQYYLPEIDENLMRKARELVPSLPKLPRPD